MQAFGRIAVIVLFAVGYVLSDLFGPQARDRVSNGIYPPALLGALIELVLILPVLAILGAWYGGTLRWVNARALPWLTASWAGVAIAAAVAYRQMVINHVAQLPRTLGSNFRLYFAAPSLLLLLVALVGLWVTVRGLAERSKGGA